MVWYQPDNFEEALTILYTKRPKIVCGGTDLFVNWNERKDDSTISDWLDIQHIPNIKKVNRTDDGFEIGASVTAADIWESQELNELPALQQAARVVGGWQIQNRASIGGNIANASPAADLVVPLVAYQAKVNITSITGTRTLSVKELITGPKQTKLADNELITSILIPNEALGMPQIFMRHDQRGGTDISLVSVAVLKRDNGCIQVAIGAANATPVFLTETDSDALTEERIKEISEKAAAQCSPVSDVRASAEYRLEMVKVFVKKGLTALK